MKSNFINAYDGIIKKAKDIAIEKSRAYGEGAIGQLGAKGEFVQIHRKYQRLKQILWEGYQDTEFDKMNNDSLDDTILDLINYSIMMKYLLDKEREELEELHIK